MMTKVLSGVARFYARRAVHDADDARYSHPSEVDLAASALRADDAAFSAERAASAHRWADLLDRTRDARLYSRQAHQLSRARALAGPDLGTSSGITVRSLARRG